jgi:hypothetical protein
MKTDPQSPCPSASLAETAGTPESIGRDPDAPEPAAEGDIWMNTPLISCAAQV